MGASVALLVASAAAVEPLRFGPYDVARLFSISKSENRNDVVYGVRLDDRCAPRGDSPVFVYWEMLERGPGVTEPVLDRELRAYGIASQRVLARGPAGGSVDLVLRAMPSRHILVRTDRVERACKAWPSLSIGGTDAYLYDIYVKLRPLGIDSLLLSGRTTDGTRVVHERVVR